MSEHKEAHLDCCGGKGYCDECYEPWPCPTIRAEAALERVKALHKPEPFYDEPSKQFCIVCQVTSGVWPCATIQAIERTRTS